ncbi:hypothetical protein LJB42_002496 [Komagataella kurtzmanii]|nr:hypothetical protein LJB42_002496 [Komagataella kurtzmanii]
MFNSLAPMKLKKLLKVFCASVVLLAATSVVLFFHFGGQIIIPIPERTVTLTTPPANDTWEFQQFFNGYLDALLENNLSYPIPERWNHEVTNVRFFNRIGELLSENKLQELIHFSPEFIEDTSDKSDNIVEQIPAKWPYENMYRGDGYVIVGGGRHTFLALLNINALRRAGNKLPVEVVLPTFDDYEEDFCENHFPLLNARCVILEERFGDQVYPRLQLGGYQYKIFAIAASSFKNCFLLDSDNIPLRKMDKIFSSELYKNKTMITWPDFWLRSTSPHYYHNITKTPIGDKRVRYFNDFYTNPNEYYYGDEDPRSEIPFHDREGTIPDWTTESGQLVINKEVHFPAILLGLFYNFNGPMGFYPLLSQGGAGEGDKDTFVAASHYYNLPYYQVYKNCEMLYGWVDHANSGRIEHSAIVQYNPIVDYENLQSVKAKAEIILKNHEPDSRKKSSKPKSHSKTRLSTHVKGSIYSYRRLFRDSFNKANSDEMFLHCHTPKIEPYRIMEDDLTLGRNKEAKQRWYGGRKNRVRFGYDVELYIWELIDQYICDKNIQYKIFEGKDRDALCGSFMREQLGFLRSTGD